MKLFNCLFIFLVMAAPALGADLADLQKIALENRQVVRKYMANLEASGKNVTVARSSYYPSVDVAYTSTWLDEGSSFQNRESRVLTGQVSWAIFSGMCDKYNVQSAKLLQVAETFKLHGIKQDIQLNVALGYLAIYHQLANL